MITEKVSALVTALSEKTRAGKFQWEDASDVDEELFRTVIGEGLVRVGRRVETWHDTVDHEPYSVTLVSVWVYGSHSREVGSAEYQGGTPGFREASELVELAKASARNSESELDELIAELKG